MIREEKGQSIVEFTLVIPILLILLVGVLDIGRMTFLYSSLHFSTQEAVRVGGLGATNEQITDRAHKSFSGNASDLTVTITPSPEMRNSGEYITLTITYPYKPLTPLISSLTEPITLSADSTIRIE